MTKKINEEEIKDISKKIDKIIKIHDFSTVQNALLAILFSILIFAITVIISKNNFDVLIRLIAGLLLMFDLPMLYLVILSIFYGKSNFKIKVLGIALFYVIVVSVMTLIVFLFGFFNSYLSPPYPVNNVVAVVILFNTFLFSIIIYNNIENRYYERYKILIEKEIHKRKPYLGKRKLVLKWIEFSEKTKQLLLKTLKKYNFQRRYSIIGALLITILTGLIKNSVLIKNGDTYGYPILWLIYRPGITPSLSISLELFILNWILHTLIVFTFLMIILKYFNFPKEKTEINNLTKLNNIGEATIKKFEGIGIYYIEEISQLEVDRLATITGIRKSRAEIILKNIDNLIQDNHKHK